MKKEIEKYLLSIGFELCQGQFIKKNTVVSIGRFVEVRNRSTLQLVAATPLMVDMNLLYWIVGYCVVNNLDK